MKPCSLRWIVAFALGLMVGLPAWAQGGLGPVPTEASARVAAVRVDVQPDRADWTYQPGEPVTFTVRVIADQHAVPAARIRYRLGPEMLPTEELQAVVPSEGLAIAGGTMDQPGFLRCVVTYDHAGTTYRGIATAGFAPGQIQPTQSEPADFDAFWSQGRELLDRLPLDAIVTPVAEGTTERVRLYHVSFNTWPSGRFQARIYGMLAEPTTPGPHPAILRVPGAGVRPYTGSSAIEYAERGFIALEIGIHGIPVNLPNALYDGLRSGVFLNYNTAHLDHRDQYYYRRVYLGCLRANDFLTSRPTWDGRNLLVQGGSQGGQLAVVTAALDSRVTAAASSYPAYSDVTGYLHGRAGGWPHMMRDERSGHRTEAKILTTSYYDVVNFARRLRVPILFTWGYNDETCPPTSLYAAYNVVTAPKELVLALEAGHRLVPEQSEHIRTWVAQQAGLSP